MNNFAAQSEGFNKVPPWEPDFLRSPYTVGQLQNTISSLGTWVLCSEFFSVTHFLRLKNPYGRRI